MSRTMRSAFAGLAITAILCAPNDADAQRWRDQRGQWRDPKFTFEIFPGVATYGRFLEQYVATTPVIVDNGIVDGILIDSIFLNIFRQREVSANTAFILGGSAGIWPWDQTGFRLSYAWSPTDLSFDDDSGTDFAIVIDTPLVEFDRLNFLVNDDVADLDVHVISIEILRLILNHRARFIPYVTAGFNGTFWVLGDQAVDDVVVIDSIAPIFVRGDNGTEFRLGASAGIGVQYRVSRKFGVRLEASFFRLGNPFDGDDAFVTTTGITFDEPDDVTQTRVTLRGTYSILHKR